MQAEREFERPIVGVGVQDTSERRRREVLDRFERRYVVDDRQTREKFVAMPEEEFERRHSPAEEDVDLSIGVLLTQVVAHDSQL